MSRCIALDYFRSGLGAVIKASNDQAGLWETVHLAKATAEVLPSLHLLQHSPSGGVKQETRQTRTLHKARRGKYWVNRTFKVHPSEKTTEDGQHTRHCRKHAEGSTRDTHNLTAPGEVTAEHADCGANNRGEGYIFAVSKCRRCAHYVNSRAVIYRSEEVCWSVEQSGSRVPPPC